MKLRKITFLGLCFFISHCLLAQQEEKWQLRFSAGLGLPVGEYARVAPAQGITFQQENDIGSLNGFDKRGNSYAEAGRLVELGVSYLLDPHWTLSFSAGHGINPVNTEVMATYLRDFTGQQWPEHSSGSEYAFRIEQDDYRITYFLAGPAYVLSSGNFSLEAGPRIGLGLMNFPDYDIYYLWLPDDFRLGHRGSTPLLSSFVAGISLKADYQLNGRMALGILSGFLSSDFNYRTTLSFPGIAIPLEKDDAISYRLLQLALSFSYSL